MDDSSVNLVGVVEQLQSENERLRMRLFKAYNSRSFLDFIDVRAVGGYLYENAAFIAAGASIIVAIVYCVVTIVETIHGLRRK